MGITEKDVLKTVLKVPQLEEQLEEVETSVNGWEEFKSNGGTIGGSVTVGNEHSKAYQCLVIKRQKDETNEQFTLFQDINNKNDYGALGFIYDGGQTSVRLGKNKTIVPNDNEINLGTPQAPWKDIYLNGGSKDQNGYTKLPNGMIMQWGVVTGSGWRAFKISFPTKCIQVTVTPIVSFGSDPTYVPLTASRELNNLGFDIVHYGYHDIGTEGTTIENAKYRSIVGVNNFQGSSRYIAIGY